MRQRIAETLSKLEKCESSAGLHQQHQLLRGHRGELGVEVGIHLGQLQTVGRGAVVESESVVQDSSAVVVSTCMCPLEGGDRTVETTHHTHHTAHGQAGPEGAGGRGRGRGTAASGETVAGPGVIEHTEYIGNRQS